MRTTVYKTLNELKEVNPGLVERFKNHMESRMEPVYDTTMVVIRPPQMAHHILGTEDAMYYYFDRETGYAIQESCAFNLGID